MCSYLLKEILHEASHAIHIDGNVVVGIIVVTLRLNP